MTPSIYRVSDGVKVGTANEPVTAGATQLGYSPDRTRMLYFVPSTGAVQVRDALTFVLQTEVKVELPFPVAHVRPWHHAAVTSDGRFAVLSSNGTPAHVVVVRLPDPPARKP